MLKLGQFDTHVSSGLWKNGEKDNLPWSQTVIARSGICIPVEYFRVLKEDQSVFDAHDSDTGISAIDFVFLFGNTVFFISKSLF